MQYNSHHRQEYSQNYIKDLDIVRTMISFSSVSQAIPVLDIGVGRGVISKVLIEEGYSVIGYEIDKKMIDSLHYLKDHPKFELRTQDILRSPFPSEEFAIISNPPFQIFSQLIKKIYQDSYNPNEVLLVGQKEAVERVVGVQQQSVMSILLNSLYNCDIPYQFEQTDFTPVPNVDIVLLKAQRIPTPLWEDKDEFEEFVTQGFVGNKSTLGKNLREIFSFEQWKRLAKTYQFSAQALPSELNVNQWKGLWNYYRKG